MYAFMTFGTYIMYIPELKVSMIDFETNARFICNYCSKEKAENKTRPFFEKTIKLYPELSDVQKISDDAERDEFIRQVVIKKLMDRVKQCYADSEGIEAFIENAYELMKGANV